MKVLLVDDHPMVLSALQTIIHGLDSGTEVLSAGHPDEAFARLAADPGIELVLLDLWLGERIDGFAVLAELRARCPELPVVVVSATERLTDMVRVIDMGAMGFVPKRSSNDELRRALALVLGGGVYIPQALLGLARSPGTRLADAAAAADEAAGRQPGVPLAQAMGGWTGSTPVAPREDAAGLAAAALLPDDGGEMALRHRSMAELGLTPRQSEVLALLLKGLSNKLIARQLNVTVDTVKDHVAAVLRALGVSSRTQAVLVVSGLTQQARRPPG